MRGRRNGRFKRQCGFLLGSGLPLVLDYIQVDGRCWTAKTDPGELEMVFQKIQSDYPNEWLLTLEILEQLVEKSKNGHGQRARSLLIQIKEIQPEIAKLIDDGLVLIDEKAVLQL
ncbi:MAG: hypothetical protein KAQ79_05935 [Cyclobacteriaceae bacterium]|nr:hypothetical protein [Cyclobacteriaceae bacterium]